MTQQEFIVHSDKERKPRYYVTYGIGETVVFESNSGSDAVQWAIDHSNVIEIDGTITLDHSVFGQTQRIVKKK